MRKYWSIMMLAIILMVFGAATQPVLALVMKPILDSGFHLVDSSNNILIPLFLILLAIIRSICNFFSDYLFSLVSNNVLSNIRSDMFRKLLFLPDSYYLSVDSGKILNKFTVDANNITNSFTDIVTILIRESIITIGLLLVLFYMSWLLTLIVLLMLPIIIIITRFFIKKIKNISKNILSMNAELTRVVNDSIKGQRVIKLFNGYDIEKNRFDSVNKDLRKFTMRAAIADSSLAPLVHLCVAISVSLIVAIALNQANSRTMTVGEFGSFMAALAQIPDPIRRLTNVFSKLQKVLVSAESVFSLIDSNEEDDFHSNIVEYSAGGNIEYRNVMFKFPNAETSIIRNVSFSIKAGEVVALVGRSGCGKTTLINMLSRFIYPDSGQILIDGFNINDMTLKVLRSNISFVGQDVLLFNDTIAANICYGLSNVDTENIRNALEAVNLLGFIETLPDGLYTKVGECATRLSGGQRQRISIARALVKNSPIIVLDEATSSLDNESEKHVQESLEKLMRNRTTLIIAHRLSTVRNVSRIFVIDSGVIIETGSHIDLIKRGGLYASLYKMQFDS